MNEETMGYPDGSVEGIFTVDLAGMSLGGLSDFVKEGRYELTCREARFKAKKNGVGMNVQIVWGVTGPEGCSEVGKTLVCHHPIMPGAPGDRDVQKKNYFINAALLSMLVHAGKFPESGPFAAVAVNPKTMVGGKVAAFVVEAKTQDGEHDVGEVKGYLMPSQYAAAPGPSGWTPAKAQQAQATTQTQAVTAQPGVAQPVVAQQVAAQPATAQPAASAEAITSFLSQ